MSTNLDLPGKKTDLYPITLLKIEELDRIITDKLMPWRMMPARRWKMNVTNYYGKVISYEGVKLEGTPMLVLWDNFIEPFLKNGAVYILKYIYQLCTEKNLDPHIYMKEASEILKLLNRKTYESMGEICSGSRNRGFPEGVTPVNIEGRIKDMNMVVDSLATAIMKEGERARKANQINR